MQGSRCATHTLIEGQKQERAYELRDYGNRTMQPDRSSLLNYISFN